MPYDGLGDAKIFHFGYPPSMSRLIADDGEELAEMFRRVRDRGIVTSLDMNQPDPTSAAGRLDWAALLKRVLPHVDLFLPSIDELLFMLDRGAFDRGVSFANVTGETVRGLGQRILHMGIVVAFIKLGDRGLYLRTTHEATRLAAICSRVGARTEDWVDREMYAPCFRAREVVGTTGSGDCTIAGFLAALVRGESAQSTATTATAVGASSVEATDATGSIRPWAQLKQLQAAGWPRLPATGFTWGEDVTTETDVVGTVRLKRTNKK